MKYVEAYDIMNDRYVAIGWIGPKTGLVTWSDGKLKTDALTKLSEYLKGEHGPDAVKNFDDSPGKILYY